MKKTLKVMVATLCVAMIAPVAMAGLFETCVSLAGGNSENSCGQDPETGACSGQCYNVVHVNYKGCQNSWSPWCGGSSIGVYYIYNGSCSGSGCGCVMPSSPSQTFTDTNPCG